MKFVILFALFALSMGQTIIKQEPIQTKIIGHEQQGVRIIGQPRTEIISNGAKIIEQPIISGYGSNIIKGIGSDFIRPYSSDIISPYSSNIINPYGAGIINPYSSIIGGFDSKIVNPYSNIISQPIISQPGSQIISNVGSKIYRQDPYDARIINNGLAGHGIAALTQSYYLVGDASQTAAWLNIPRNGVVGGIINGGLIQKSIARPELYAAKQQPIISIQKDSDLILPQKPEGVISYV